MRRRRVLSRLTLRSPRPVWSAAALMLLALCVAACSIRSERIERSSVLEECRVPTFEEEALCGALAVPENPDDLHDRPISLNIVVLPAVDGRQRPDAVLYLVGGPGFGATTSAATFARELSLLRETHDIVLVDQRGTGRSNPLHCQLSPEEMLGAMLAGRFEPSAIELCLEDLDADPVFYTSAEIIQDLEAVRSALGYEQFNLVGVSYGSRLALGYLQTFPTRVRTVALRGVSSPAGNLLSVIGAASERAIGRLFSRCSENPECSSEFPDLEPTLRCALSRLEDRPLTLRVERPDGSSVELTVTRDLFAGVIRYALYSDSSAPLALELIHDAAESRWELLARALSSYLEPGLASSLSFGSYLSIVCAEDMPFFERSTDSGTEDSLFLTSSVIDNHRAACDLWPHRAAPAESKRPVSSAVPALLMSGSEDPATSAEAAERIGSLLTDSRHLVTPGLSHFPMWTDCFAANVARTVQTGSTTAVDDGCVQDYAAVGLGTS